MKFFHLAGAALTLLCCATLVAQQPAPGGDGIPLAIAAGTLPNEPQILDAGGQRVRVVPIKGLDHPWALAVLPNLDILVTERVGRLRIIRNGKLDPQPISGVPTVNTGATLAGLMDVILHPRYAENKQIYFTYSKGMPGGPFPDVVGKRDAATVTLVRARYDGGNALADVREIFQSDAWAQGTSAGRIAFAKDGTIILAIGLPVRHKIGTADDAQNPRNHAGKILRLNDDGSVPKDNPFVGRTGYRPEIYALGIRNAIGLFVHPDTGAIWETENGPMGGDEINIIQPGRNYGWPVVSYGKDYSGNKTGGSSGTTTPHSEAEGMEEPFLYWMPSPAVTGITIYTGDKFPRWKGNIIVGAMGGANLGARQLHRIMLNRNGQPQRSGTVPMLAELKQRIRDVRQGPDGLLYLTTDEPDGAVLRIEPADPPR